MEKMIARRITKSYLGLFLTAVRDDGSREAAVARIGTFEVRLIEIPSVNASEEMSLWVELLIETFNSALIAVDVVIWMRRSMPLIP